jgi:cephalosporin-C deacetylase-like acetyl esterase/lysophospholipase L1-like esterase
MLHLIRYLGGMYLFASRRRSLRTCSTISGVISMQLRPMRKRFVLHPFAHVRTCLILAAATASNLSNSGAAQLKLVPDHASGIYELGEKVGWTVTIADGDSHSGATYKYTAKKNNLELVKSGEFDLSSGKARIEVPVSEPEMVYVEVKPADDGADSHPAVAGAAVAPSQLKPDAPRPADFDDFWAAEIAALKAVPANPLLSPGDSGTLNVDYATITMDNIDGAHIHGQLAKPKKEGKLPALVIFQWASPPYPLQKTWVTDHAQQGWLTLNVEPHDVLPDQPQSYYDALPSAIKHYESIGNNDRDRSYFLRMYLGDYRALDYIADRPDWDGKTLVVMGTSMGGQQSLCVAGLHPKVTHLIVNVPAGCDTNGPLHGRQASYPFFPPNDPKIMETALYFDAVNFAPKIKAKSMVAFGFVDTISAPAGIWTAFNLIPGEKEAVPMIDSPHNHQATAEQQRAYTERSAEWLSALAKGGPIKPRESTRAVVAVPQGPDDHQLMMTQLGIEVLRPGANSKDPETYNESTANRFKDTLPDVLTFKDGTRVTQVADWTRRRAEIVEDFEREIYGRIPKNVPKVTWEVQSTTAEQIGKTPVVTKSLLGHVDNSDFPSKKVDIQAVFTVPANPSTGVPVMIVFTRPFGGKLLAGRPGADTPWTEQAIKHGWGYALLDTESIQPDNAAGLRSGIIGLTNHGAARAPDEWGALRAWQWGASRLIDYFESNSDAHVDATKIGIEGVSRYGKAALVTEALDQRVAVGLIASSGEGGAKLYRHVFGETVENLTGGESYWMAGNFLKYGAEKSSFGAKTTADLPVDAHELIALCAPRPCFISYGSVEGGDPNWVDARGSFMAGVLASPVYRLLGKQGLGTLNDYLAEPMPPVGKLVGGELAWRQHAGGHDVTPNWPSFFGWIDQYIKSPVVKAASAVTPAGSQNVESVHSDARAIQPVERTDVNSRSAHRQLVEKARQGGIDVYFVGDSITRRWGCTDAQYSNLFDNWRKNFFGWNAGNFGWGGDTIESILWRLQNGELEGVAPKAIVILAGTNNLDPNSAQHGSAEEIANGIRAILDQCRSKAPDAAIIVTAIFPRSDKPNLMSAINDINDRISRLADGKRVFFLNVNQHLAHDDGTLFDGMLIDGLHPTANGYQVWADGLKPILTQLLGPPAKTDHAPPPTGNPAEESSSKPK